MELYRLNVFTNRCKIAKMHLLDCMYYFYILKSEHDHEYYYGSTKDLKIRVNEHNRGNVTSTKHRRPLRLVYYEAYVTLNQAITRERQVKTSGSIRKNIHARIK